MIVAEQSYTLTDPTIHSQIIALKAAGADTVVNLSTPKFSAQAIRKIHDMGWRPLHLITYAGSAVNVLQSAGLEKSIGLIAAYFAKLRHEVAYIIVSPAHEVGDETGCSVSRSLPVHASLATASCEATGTKRRAFGLRHLPRGRGVTCQHRGG